MISNWREFCDQVITTDEIDPLYGFAVKATADKGPLWGNRFVLHLLTFYDVGGAVEAANLTSEGSFWDYVISNYDSFPRGTNRRHSRGDLGKQYVINCEKIGPPSVFLEQAWAPNYSALVKVFQNTFHGCGYGPYFIWKVMDYQDRVLGRPVQLLLHDAVRYMPDEARKGAALLWPGVPLADVMTKMVQYMWKYEAPGLPTRKCGYSEVETMLCALRGYYNDVYVIGEDITERRKQLKMYPQFVRFLPPIPERHDRPNPLDPQALSAGIP